MSVPNTIGRRGIRTFAALLTGLAVWGVMARQGAGQPPVIPAEAPPGQQGETALTIESVERQLAAVDQLPELDDAARGGPACVVSGSDS